MTLEFIACRVQPPQPFEGRVTSIILRQALLERTVVHAVMFAEYYLQIPETGVYSALSSTWRFGLWVETCYWKKIKIQKLCVWRMIKIRHHASSAGCDQLPTGPALPLFSDQGQRGTMTQDSPRPEVIIWHPAPSLQFLESPANPFLASIFRCPQK